MKGFIGGSLLLIALYVGVQPETSRKVEQGAGILTGMLRRWMSPEVALVPNRRIPARGGRFAETVTPAPAPGPQVWV